MTTYRLRGGPADGGSVETDAHGPPKRIRIPLGAHVEEYGWPSWVILVWGDVSMRLTVDYEWAGKFYRYKAVFRQAAT